MAPFLLIRINSRSINVCLETNMKVKDLFEAVKGNWRISNLNGVVKTFKDEDSPEAKAWMRNRDTSATMNKDIDREIARREKLEREDAAAQRREEAAKKKAKAEAMKKVLDKADDALAYAIDGGDPMDSIGGWMRRNKIEMEDIDAAVNKEHKLKGGLYAYIAQAWQDMQGDRIADARRELAGQTDKKQKRAASHNSFDDQFYRIEDGKIIPEENPWGSAK